MFWPIGPFHSTKTCYKHSKNTTRRISFHFSPSAYSLDYFMIFFGFVVVDWKWKVVFLCMGGLHHIWCALISATQTSSKGDLTRDPHLSVYVHMHFNCILIWWGADALVHNSRNRDGQGAKRPTPPFETSETEINQGPVDRDPAKARNRQWRVFQGLLGLERVSVFLRHGPYLCNL